jgi:hypothetical protein
MMLSLLLPGCVPEIPDANNPREVQTEDFALVVPEAWHFATLDGGKHHAIDPNGTEVAEFGEPRFAIMLYQSDLAPTEVEASWSAREDLVATGTLTSAFWVANTFIVAPDTMPGEWLFAVIPTPEGGSLIADTNEDEFREVFEETVGSLRFNAEEGS